MIVHICSLKTCRIYFTASSRRLKARKRYHVDSWDILAHPSTQIRMRIIKFREVRYGPDQPDSQTWRAVAFHLQIGAHRLLLLKATEFL